MRGVIFLLLLVGCTSPQPKPPPPPNLVPTTDAAVKVVAVDAPIAVVEVDAPPPVEEPPPPADLPTIAIPDPVPPVKGPVTKIAEKTTATIAGIKITFTHSSHKSGGELGMWGFELVRFGAKQEFELRSEGSNFEAEVDAKGTLLVFRHVDYTTFEIVLAAAKTPKLFDEDACRAEIEKAAAARKLTVGDSSSTSADMGIVRMSTKGWVGHCGQYTHRVWFTPPRADRRRRR
jgi:hypothetical protein